MVWFQASLALEQHEEVIMTTGKLIKIDRGNIDALALRAEAYYRIGEVERMRGSGSGSGSGLGSGIGSGLGSGLG